jgi:hypothetical protein
MDVEEQKRLKAEALKTSGLTNETSEQHEAVDLLNKDRYEAEGVGPGDQGVSFVQRESGQMLAGDDGIAEGFGSDRAPSSSQKERNALKVTDRGFMDYKS